MWKLNNCISLQDQTSLIEIEFSILVDIIKCQDIRQFCYTMQYLQQKYQQPPQHIFMFYILEHSQQKWNNFTLNNVCQSELNTISKVIPMVIAFEMIFLQTYNEQHCFSRFYPTMIGGIFFFNPAHPNRFEPNEVEQTLFSLFFMKRQLKQPFGEMSTSIFNQFTFMTRSPSPEQMSSKSRFL